MTPQETRIQRLVEVIFAVHPQGDCDCDSCSDQLCCIVELVMSGANLAELLPAVEEHLRCCPDCNEEFQAMLCILRAEQNGDISAIC